MRIVHLVSGAGGMICGSCLQSNTLAAAIIREGEDLVLLPIYTPLRTDEPNVAHEEVSHGGILAYMLHKLPILNRAPGFIHDFLNWKPLLEKAGKLSGATNPAKLGPLSCAMLSGDKGPMKSELDKLVRRLEVLRPDIVQLSNALISGMAPGIADRLGVPVCCGLSGEDLFLDQLPSAYREKAVTLIAENAKSLSAAIAMNRYYANRAAEFLKIPPEIITVIEPGLNLEGFGPKRDRANASEEIRIGYLARIAPEKGLDRLVEAFIEISQRKLRIPPIRFLAAGHLPASGKKYLRSVERRLRECELENRFEYIGELGRAGKIGFLRSLDIFSVPSVYPEAKGLSILEAMACGVPCVQPRSGSYTEILESTGGGILVEPDETKALADGLLRLIEDRKSAEKFGASAREAVFERFDIETTARKTIKLYEKLVRRAPGR